MIVQVGYTYMYSDCTFECSPSIMLLITLTAAITAAARAVTSPSAGVTEIKGKMISPFPVI